MKPDPIVIDFAAREQHASLLRCSAGEGFISFHHDGYLFTTLRGRCWLRAAFRQGGLVECRANVDKMLLTPGDMARIQDWQRSEAGMVVNIICGHSLSSTLAALHGAWLRSCRHCGGSRWSKLYFTGILKPTKIGERA